MNIDLLYDYQLRGAVLENGARILLRRVKSNNFIFCCRYFDSIEEITTKYRLNYSDFQEAYNFLNKNGMHTDIIEFVLDDKINRKIVGINFYDVKSKIFNSNIQYFEMCLSNYEFMNSVMNLGCGTFIVSLVLFKEWNLDFEIKEFTKVTMRVYDSSEKKTVLFLRR